ncbi:MAG: sulfur carrier protein ThiS adenylyltransferase ThiF, partial [Deltaproteobacteria bacterium]|nr:sulfur carrier protein ThiS adenylyltransferase ThiF [Deltaproteobacteria bacterium]
MTTLARGLGRYFSSAALDALRAARVGIIGAGGLGSNVAMLLARSGIRRMTIADPDIVDASNLNRQAYFPDDVGRPKVQALARALLTLEPAMRLAVHELAVTTANARTLFEDCPLIVEAVDRAETKAELYALFAPEKELYVTASGMAGFGGCMVSRRPRPNVAAVGDFASAVDRCRPPLAPRVMQAAAMQADAVLEHILSPLT